MQRHDSLEVLARHVSAGKIGDKSRGVPKGRNIDCRPYGTGQRYELPTRHSRAGLRTHCEWSPFAFLAGKHKGTALKRGEKCAELVPGFSPGKEAGAIAPAFCRTKKDYEFLFFSTAIARCNCSSACCCMAFFSAASCCCSAVAFSLPPSSSEDAKSVSSLSGTMMFGVMAASWMALPFGV